MRRNILIATALALLVTPHVRTERPYRHLGPDSKLRLDVNLGWVVQLPVPDPYVDLIGKHVTAMKKAGYFADLSGNDLFHCHLLMKWGAKNEYETVDGLMEDTELVLYHTAEFAGRWEREKHLPSDRRNPRSIVGYKSGSVVPAIALISQERREELDFYEPYGTIHEEDLFPEFPGALEGYASEKILRIGPQKGCGTTKHVILAQETFGRLELPDGRKYDAFVRCKIDPREWGLYGYNSKERSFIVIE